MLMNWVASCPTQSHHWWVGKRSKVALQSTKYSALQCITVHYWVALQCTTGHRDQVNPGFGATWPSPILQSRPAMIFLLTINHIISSIPYHPTIILSSLPSHPITFLTMILAKDQAPWNCPACWHYFTSFLLLFHSILFFRMYYFGNDKRLEKYS